MLGQGGLGVPNLAAPAVSTSAGTLTFVQNTTTIFAPIMIHQAVIPVTPAFVVNQSTFFAPLVRFDQTITLQLVQNQSTIRVPSVVWDFYRYTYPIGRYPDSDYGMRSSLTNYKKRLIIGRK